MYYTIEHAPRANPEGRLDMPYNVVHRPYSLGRSMSGDLIICGQRTIVRHCYSRDDAEERLYKMAQKNGWEEVGHSQYRTKKGDQS